MTSDRSTPASALTGRFVEALTYACELHGDQRRKGSGTPYVAHLLAVAALVIESGGSEEMSISALLHDAIEDQGGSRTRQEIERRFGAEVEALVVACSDHLDGPKRSWRERKETFHRSLERAAPEVLAIVAADKLHNARSVIADFEVLRGELWDRFKGGREGTLWNYRVISRLLSRRLPENRSVIELSRLLPRLEALA